MILTLLPGQLYVMISKKQNYRRSALYNEPATIGERIAGLAEDISQNIASSVDIRKLSNEREYLTEFTDKFIQPLIVNKARKADPEDLILEIYFQVDPNATPQLSEHEYCAGVCLENTGKWIVKEHNLTHIKDIKEENTFLKWWYFETIRVNVAGWTKSYFDSYLEHDVISYTTPVWADADHFIGVLGIDIDYDIFVSRINRRFVENIHRDVQKLKEGYRSIGVNPDSESRYLNTYATSLIEHENNCIAQQDETDQMQQVDFLIRKACESDITVLLQGETGTGKDYIAKNIHDNSSRADGPFINLNCGALSESLIESELFGYIKGAFTGARAEGSGGYIAAAHGGTLFLNEIGELPVHLQVKLLNVIQDREIVRVGDTKKSKIDFRLIVASNRNLSDLVKNNMFRKDLYFRINTLTINIPPLRKRQKEIRELSGLFLERFNIKYNTEKHISESLMQFFLQCHWPGNIRELENLIERMVLTSEGDYIEIDDLPMDFLEFSGYPLQKPAIQPVAADKRLKAHTELTEKEVITEAYRRLGSSYKVAKELGISQSQAYKKIKKYFD